ncbi:NAD(P)/FAD-dependent oxidoreductase [Fibrisoma montanum]|uniref:NAD(P)/FAD-dependent oxidoreductase n=1 Tax=Fibrisoma montanum TaxID=2305895 RepID=A0A418MFG4_9BACT|nr:NAD(P)/FAD-dependent oxidoreductase [Fibrisoma montanum]RIV25463.1 NAD(P)/FAD-dependent oxidoreductase [Fibrisoma montanum]
MQQFDAIVIGTGVAGKSTAEQLHQAGKSVAIIDKLPFGGTCSQRGCDPKKILAGAAELVARSERMRDNGLAAEARIDWPELIRFKRTFTDPIPEKTEQQFKETGITAFHGTARFIAPDAVQVGDTQLQADHIVIAAGARPAPLGIPGEDLLTDSTAFMELEQLPNDIVMVGGGYIAFEFAHVASRAGAKVTIVHQGERPLEPFDPDLVDLLVSATEAMGITLLLNAEVVSVEGEPGTLRVGINQQGQERSLNASLVVHAAGRPADLQDLDLDKAGVEYSDKGVAVNEFLQSPSNPAVYACGDVAEKGLPLTPVASWEAGIVGANILNGNQQRYTETAVPSVVFTWPNLATVGMSEESARQSGKNIRVSFSDTTDWYESRRINEPVSGYKLLIDDDNGLLMGAHLLGVGSDELINVLTLAINHRIPVESLRTTLFAYPTRASGLASMLKS